MYTAADEPMPAQYWHYAFDTPRSVEEHETLFDPFILATVLILYYKQVSEGYEDQARFGIMQNIGMTEKEIRRSINSQLLTVFFLPLVGVGIFPHRAPSAERLKYTV